jgi:adenylate kinase family enzyme
MNKVISEFVIHRGKQTCVDSLKDNSNIEVTVECKHGQRKVRWSRRNQLCKKCAIEKGAFNTSKVGRKITWGNKISKAKKNIKLSEEHKNALIKSRIRKICKKKNIDESQFDGFPTSGCQFKLRCFVMSAINKKITKYSVHQQDSMILNNLGYSVEQLRQHLEYRFKEGMTWENYGQWQIDHVKPESWFSYSSSQDDQFKQCWSLDNLQPMWASENLDKSNKYDGDYVPRKFYMLAGQFGVGKTTLCKELHDKFTIVHYDKINIKKLDSFIANNYFNKKPILIDIPANISTIFNRYKNKYEIDLILLIESPEVVAERISKRGGSPDINNIKKRYSRMLYIKDNYAKHSGSYDEVLSFLLNLET